MKYINPKNDVAFKKIFANDKNGEEFIVEMQVQRQDFLKVETRQCLVSTETQQLKRDKLKPVYFIGIVDFNIFETKKYMSKHLILDVETNKNELKDFQFVFIELPKFNKKLSKLDKLSDKWIYFIKYAQSFKGIPKEFENDTEIIDALEEINKYNLTEEQLDIYEYWEMDETKQRDILQTAQRVAKEEGEHEKAVEIAKKMLKKGSLVEDVAEMTGLSIDEIEKIKTEM